MGGVVEAVEAKIEKLSAVERRGLGEKQRACVHAVKLVQ